MNFKWKNAGVLVLIHVWSGALIYFGVVGLQAIYLDQTIGKASLNWPTVKGHVIESRFYEEWLKDGGARLTYAFNYTYKVDDEDLTSSRFGIVAKEFTRKEMKEKRREYPQGKEVTVYYDPQRPDFALIIPGPDQENCVKNLILGLFLFPLGVISYVLLLRRFFTRIINPQDNRG